MKNSLDMLLPEDYSTLCRAVLLGEKTALDESVVMISSQIYPLAVISLSEYLFIIVLLIYSE